MASKQCRSLASFGMTCVFSGWLVKQRRQFLRRLGFIDSLQTRRRAAALQKEKGGTLAGSPFFGVLGVRK